MNERPIRNSPKPYNKLIDSHKPRTAKILERKLLVFSSFYLSNRADRARRLHIPPVIELLKREIFIATHPGVRIITMADEELNDSFDTIANELLELTLS